ncbi:MAG TPA: potassium-transporting ATPase subunit KdpA [Anaerolineaceae bacterium]|nr:potassium-transporting ATPase subunit KdpA [Anaerolineaceae bacterium]HBA91513.1 potassium-transporting ATPase subunit KdpA [Anaerolineaceae bacterium]
MTLNGWIQIVVFFALLLVLVKPLGGYMAKVYGGERTLLSPVVGPLERRFYRIASVLPDAEMNWKTYGLAVLAISIVGIAFLYALQRLQHLLPLNPLGFGPVAPDLAFNTAVSFVTNTNWQNYGGETTMSFLTQMAGLTVQNFLSAATGMAVLITFIRGFARHQASTLGNFWVDLTRGMLYILLPLSIVIALLLAALGTVQTLTSSTTIRLLEGGGEQVIALGPAASQVAIKHLGTNGGGFFNANSAHPFENPTPLANLILMLAETSIPAALSYTYGRMIGNTRQGWAVLAAMMIILVGFSGVAYSAEAAGNPRLASLGVDQIPSGLQPGGNMEGKELRFGVAPSALFASITTATSSGAVNSMHDSFTPLGGMVPLVLMQLGEVALGGVGSGLYGMLVFVLVAVFVAGLMVGRTPEYLGKKIEPFEMKMAALLILIMPILVLGLTALAVSLDAARASISNPGPHGFSQILYAFTSQGNNNGSAFGGLGGNTLFFNYTGALAMFIARFWLIFPTLALAGSLAAKKKVPSGAGTLPTTSPLFIGWTILIILLVGALNFLPALALGPIIEHLIMAGV